MRRTPVACLVAALGIACARAGLDPVEPAPLPAESPAAAPIAMRVEGVVTDRWGYVVPHAWVTVRVGSPHPAGASDPGCAGATHLPTRTRSSPTGEFSVEVEAGRRPPFHACLEVEVLPPRGLPWRENRVIVPSVAFAPANQASEPVRVRVVLY